MIYVLVLNGVVQNVIVADQSFIDQISPSFDAIVSFKETDSYPGLGWTYDGKTFTPVNITAVSIDQEITIIDNELQKLDPTFNQSASQVSQIQPNQGVTNA